MKLKDYLREHGIRQQDFADSIGVSIHAIRGYVMGIKTPSLRNMQKIRKITDYLVDIDDFLE